MAFSPKNRKGTISGIVFVALVAASATWIAGLGPVKALGLSPLVVGIVIGIFYANTLHNRFPPAWETGITFSAKKILRFAIVFYGFRITFQQIAHVGLEGFLVSLTMLVSTFILGSWLGIKRFGLDRDTAMLTASGASVCGAAAVLATEPVLKAEEYKAAIAVSMVVLFGTVSMFLYPVLYAAIFQHAHGFLHLSPEQYGIYVGGTVHEVAQVVAAAGINGPGTEMANNAVIVKMTRVLLIAPMLILLGLYLSRKAAREGGAGAEVKLVIPWFAVYFLGMAAFNSFDLLPHRVVGTINAVDTFLLTMAMSALGMGTRFAKFKGVGLAPLYTALGMYLWLVIGGFVVVKVITGSF
ncbi:YeiH family protein [Nitratifractor sp.]